MPKPTPSSIVERLKKVATATEKLATAENAATRAREGIEVDEAPTAQALESAPVITAPQSER